MLLARVTTHAIDTVKMKRQTARPNVPPDVSELSKVAVHEAGHALAAWYCTAIRKVERVTIEPEGGADGHVEHTIFKKAYWCQAVILLSGMAAEVLVFGVTRSGRASSDLSSARIAVNACTTPPSWPVPAGRSLAFSDMFTTPLSDAEAERLSISFRMATHILRRYEVQFYRLVSLLMAQRRLTAHDITPLLGDRRILTIIGMIDPNPDGFCIPSNDTLVLKPDRWQIVKIVVKQHTSLWYWRLLPVAMDLAYRSGL